MCYPKDGEELARAVQADDCSLIFLTRNYFDPYYVRTQMIVSSPKIIMGSPVTLPALRPLKIERLFHGRHTSTMPFARL